MKWRKWGIQRGDGVKMSGTQGATARWWNNDQIASFIPGGIAGALSRTLSAPFERVKVLYQVQGPGTLSYNEGIFKTLAKIWREEGFKGFLRGNGINCIRVFPYSAVQYATYQNMKMYFLSHSPQSKDLTSAQKLFSGAVAGTLSVLATYPMDLVKTRLSIQTASLKNLQKSRVDSTKIKPPGIFKSLITIYRTEGGLKSLYRGFLPTVLGVAPYTSLSFTFYESLKQLIPAHEDNLISKLVMGGFSGACAQTLIYPFDLLRRRFQVASMGNSELGFKYNSISHAFVTIVKTEGLKGLYKGLTLNLFKIVPQMAIQWTSYELIRDYMKK